MTPAASAVRIDHGTSSGTFSLDGQTFEVENNIWVIGDDRECLIIDAPHRIDDVLAVVAGRRVRAIVCTHAHDDHVRIAPELGRRVGAPVLLHPADLPVWRLTHPQVDPDGELAEGQLLDVGGAVVRVIHTPGHSPGAVCLVMPELGVVFTGDTLFHGGPGATSRSFSDHDTIIASIRSRLLTLPPETVVHTGHGQDTTIGAEAAGLAQQ